MMRGKMSILGMAHAYVRHVKETIKKQEELIASLSSDVESMKQMVVDCNETIANYTEQPSINDQYK